MMIAKHTTRTLSAALIFAAALLVLAIPGMAADSEYIRPYPQNPRYWEYQGRPVVLLGGSKQDNLFQIPDLEEHLKLLASVGGNYVRNTMSARDAGNVQPFAQREDGRYDLERWNAEYWRRFERLLQLTRALDIVVQIEIWDRFDYSGKAWDTQPFNPKNNVNYTYEASGFAEKYPEHPGANTQPFFHTTPKQSNNAVVLRYQRRFMDELLRRTLRYPNVLYCIDNETSGDEAWSAHWAEYVRDRARAAGKRVFTTEMWDEWDLKAPRHRHTLDHPVRYDFVDVSQNNHQRGDNHWNNFHWVRAYLDPKPRPINTVKTYGADTRENRTGLVGTWEWWGRLANRPTTVNTARDYGTTQHGTERWWRHLIGGAAGVRFHRPDAGIGLNAVAQQHVRSAREFLKEFDIVRAEPDAEHELLSGRQRNEAYMTRIAHEAYAIYFPNGGDVRLDVPPAYEYDLKWLGISSGKWNSGGRTTGESVRLQTPESGQWVALLVRKEAVSAGTR